MISGIAAILPSLLALSGEVDRDLAACAAKINAAERLSCYDDLAKTRNVASPEIETAKNGDWNVQTETSKVDDSKNVYLRVDSIDTFRDRYGNSKSATFFITCQEHSTQTFFVLGGMFLADTGGFGDVTVRIDRNKAQTMSLTESTDNQALGIWRGAGVPFIKSLIGKTRLLLVATPYNESSITVEFNITGLGEALQPLREACSW